MDGVNAHVQARIVTPAWRLASSVSLSPIDGSKSTTMDCWRPWR